jgi:hypothetical protein
VTTFLHVFTLTAVLLCLLGASIVLWVFGLVKGTDVFADRGRVGLAVVYMFGYFVLTIAIGAGGIEAVAP